MEEFYRVNPVISCSDEIVGVDNICTTSAAGFHHGPAMDNMLQFQAAEITDLIKTQIANHPLYPNLVSAHIECQKVTVRFLLDNFMGFVFCFVFFKKIVFQKKRRVLLWGVFLFFIEFLWAYKVGAPPEMASLLEEIGRENHVLSSTCIKMGANPELDEFMVLQHI